MATATPTLAVTPDQASALVGLFDAKTLALLAEAAELHGDTLARLDSRTGDGALGEDAAKLRAGAQALRNINQIRHVVG